MINAIRKILSSEDCYKNRLNCIDDGTCRDCENEHLSKMISEHDSELLDKVAEKLKAEVNVCKNCMIIGCDTEYFRPMCEKAEKGFIVAEVEEIVDTVITELKAEVEKCQ